jgi:hypothetical protein
MLDEEGWWWPGGSRKKRGRWWTGGCCAPGFSLEEEGRWRRVGREGGVPFHGSDPNPFEMDGSDFVWTAAFQPVVLLGKLLPWIGTWREPADQGGFVTHSHTTYTAVNVTLVAHCTLPIGMVPIDCRCGFSWPRVDKSPNHCCGNFPWVARRSFQDGWIRSPAAVPQLQCSSEQ